MFDHEMREAAEHVLYACRKRKLKVVTAESCTGGLIAATLTAIAGSSDVVDRAFVTYSNEAKREMLGVPWDAILGHGAVSEPVARAMAAGALARSQRRSRGIGHRRRRPRRRHGRKAGRPGASRRGADGLRRHRRAPRLPGRPRSDPAHLGDYRVGDAGVAGRALGLP